MNRKANVIRIIGWIDIIGGIVISFILGKIFSVASIVGNNFVVKYNWTIVLIGVISCLVSGIILIGFSEIINLLQIEVNYSKRIEEILNTIKNNKDSESM